MGIIKIIRKVRKIERGKKLSRIDVNLRNSER